MEFGKFVYRLVGEFEPLDLRIDAYTNPYTCYFRVVSHYFVDVVVRHAENFAACLNISTSSCGSTE